MRSSKWKRGTAREVEEVLEEAVAVEEISLESDEMVRIVVNEGKVEGEDLQEREETENAETRIEEDQNQRATVPVTALPQLSPQHKLVKAMVQEWPRSR